MNSSQVEDEESLDPFGYFPDMASRIAGLPGGLPSHEPAYVFHTPYVTVAPGKRVFRVSFKGLSAATGTLSLRVHMLAKHPGAKAKLVDSERFSLADLAASGGSTSIAFIGYDEMTFALYGMIPDSTDAQAEQVSVTVDTVTDETSRIDDEDEATPTEGAAALRRMFAISSLEPPRFSAPVSQYWTPRQLAEPQARRWANELALTGADDRSIWLSAYMLRTMEFYGFLRPGLRGFTVGDIQQSVLDALDKRDMAVVTSALAQQEDGKADFRIPNGAFDFMISAGLIDMCASAAESVEIVLKTVDAVRGGGLAVHAFGVAPRGMELDDQSRSSMEVERLAVTLVAHGHSVAQVKLPARPRGGKRFRPEPRAVPFVLVVRRKSQKV